MSLNIQEALRENVRVCVVWLLMPRLLHACFLCVARAGSPLSL